MTAVSVKFLACFVLLPLAPAHGFATTQSTYPVAESLPESVAVSATAEMLAEVMEAVSGSWSGKERKRAEIVSGPWVESDDSFDFAFDRATRTGEVSNSDGQTFSIRAEDQMLVYSGTFAGKPHEQKRKVVGFRPTDVAGNSLVVAQYDAPLPDGTLLTVQETYRLSDGQYIRKQEVRPAGTEDEFVLIRDGRFSRVD